MASNVYTQSKLSFSKNCIFDALLALLEKKELSDISVSELTKKAGVCRSTFYRNYDDIASVIVDFLNERPLGFSNDLKREDMNNYELVANYFSYLLENRRLFTALDKRGMLHLLLDVHSRVFKNNFKPIVNDIGFVEDYEISAFIGIVYMVTADWIHNGMQGEMDEMVELSFKIITHYTGNKV